MKKAEIIDRSQKASGRWPRRGPDRYIAVVIRQDGSRPVENDGEKTTPLSSANAERYGWEIIDAGEYYYDHTGPNSRYARAIKRAHEIIKEEGAVLG